MASYPAHNSGNLIEVKQSQIKLCKYCGKEIVWLASRSGKNYPVNFVGLRSVSKVDFHKCIHRR